MKTTRYLIIALALLVITTAAVAKPRVEFKPDPTGAIKIFIDGKLFTNYIYKVNPAKPLAAPGVYLTKPVLYPLRTPSGIIVTRGWPFTDIKGETHDHPHHIGLYFTYDEVNGNDFWNNSKNPLPAIKYVSAEVTTDAKGNATLETVSNWVDTKEVTLLREVRKTTFIPEDNQYVMDFDIELQAVADKVDFGDTKEGMFAIRLAEWLTENTNPKYTRGTGSYLSSNGDEKEKGVWGKRADWVRIQGEKDGHVVGIAIFNHPGSTNYPTFWHARGYGAFSANPLGQYAFEKARKVPNAKPFHLVLTKGQKAPFKFRVIIYDGKRTKEQLDNDFKEYTR